VSFREFIGNETVVRRLREAIASNRLPPALLLAGQRGAGKYTLAVRLAQAVNCLKPKQTDGLPDYCGVCSNCVRIGEAGNLDSLVDQAVAAREELREVDKKETRILIQTHPDVLVIPPDPPQLLIKLGQVRTVIREIYRMPSEARRAFYIFTSAAFMKEAANSLLKVLEEPPPHASIVLLAENLGDLLPTIRSRSCIFRLGAISGELIEKMLAEKKPELAPAQRGLIARLSEGAAGQALSFDLDAYVASRSDGLVILHNAVRQADYSALFRMTETYRAGAEGQEKTADLLGAILSLLEDLLLLKTGAAQLIRNIDIEKELGEIARRVSFEWIEAAERAAHEVRSGMRRNLLRSLSLDALAAELAG
jgi:DNA polymerase III subunit delta'